MVQIPAEIYNYMGIVLLALLFLFGGRGRNRLSISHTSVSTRLDSGIGMWETYMDMGRMVVLLLPVKPYVQGLLFR